MTMMRCPGCFILLLSITLCNAGQRGLPASEGIANFGKVNEKLYRGAQPDAAAIQNLKRLGVKSVLCLRSPGKAWKAELAEASANGFVCTNIPLSGVRRPKAEEVKKILATISALPSPVLIHCQFGCDRTGNVIACYRIQNDNWTTEAAMLEAERHGMSKLLTGMKAFVRDFGRSTQVGRPKNTLPVTQRE